MICVGCAAGADNMEDYREAARMDDLRRELKGEHPMSAKNARRWIVKRARLALSLHCRSERYSPDVDPVNALGGPGCTCQCKIPELSEGSSYWQMPGEAVDRS